MHRSELGEMQSASERELTVGRRVLQDRGRTWSEQNRYHLRWRWWCEDHPSSRVLTLSAPSFLFKLQRGLTWKKTASVHFDACDNFFSLNEKYYPIYIYIYKQSLFSRSKNVSNTLWCTFRNIHIESEKNLQQNR